MSTGVVRRRKEGVYPNQDLEELVGTAITGDEKVIRENIQPSSIDLTLGKKAWKVKGRFPLMQGEKVEDALKKFAQYDLDLSDPNSQTLEWDATYVVELEQGLKLPTEMWAYADTKSSVGRDGLRASLLTDGSPQYDRIRKGYEGPMYVMITPQAFPVKVAAGMPLKQIRFITGDPTLYRTDLELQHDKHGLIFDHKGNKIEDISHLLVDDGIMVTVDLEGKIPCLESKNSGDVVDWNRPEKSHDPYDFWSVNRPSKKDGGITLTRGGVYLLTTKEFIRYPPHLCGGMVGYNQDSGDFKAHDAGFFDAGWGDKDKQGKPLFGTPGTSETTVNGTGQIMRHGSQLCKMMFQWQLAESLKPYCGAYQKQRGPTASKRFNNSLLYKPQSF